MKKEPVTFQPEDFAGRQAVILIFAPSERSPAYESQIGLFLEDDMLRRLDAVIVHVLLQGTCLIREDRLDEASAEMLRTAYGVGDNDFLLVLIGRDGTERFRSDAPVQPAVVTERLTDRSRPEWTV